jgi:hypothetical protein
MAALECKLAMVINTLVEFELLMELKIEQKKGNFTIYLVLKDASSLKTVLARRVQSVRPSDIFWISRVVPLGPRL